MEYEYSDIRTKEEVEEASKEEMRELLIETFDNVSVLYEIYKRRSWLDKLFTDNILSMDKDALYVSNQVATICETQTYMINNRRRELLDYINPISMGEGSSKTFKHNYISVFKMKMIIGLTGEGSEYTVPQLKEIIYSGGKPTTTTNKSEEPTSSDQMFQMMQKMKRFEKFLDMIESDEFFKEIDRRVQVTTDKLLKESSSDDEVHEKIIKLFDKIAYGNESVPIKEELFKEFDSLLELYPKQSYSINMYKTAADEKITRFKQDERELHVQKVKGTIADLIEKYSVSNSDNERDTIKNQLSRLSDQNPDMSFDIRMWLSTLSKEKAKKGLLSRFFSN
ncbi:MULTISPECIES: hypothetical protein [Paenibacillus]|uniref:Uncharacterized protein n=1 Tax=Paenibacillus odorifer TaxID=189426 RepID=A0A1R0XBX1_9BACL|nr:hypothetical protein [Paenibacillus odorifer]OMD32575.1 hypothetical protein BJP51_15865 [Paenibacillus odorifer]